MEKKEVIDKLKVIKELVREHSPDTIKEELMDTLNLVITIIRRVQQDATYTKWRAFMNELKQEIIK